MRRQLSLTAFVCALFYFHYVLIALPVIARGEVPRKSHYDMLWGVYPEQKSGVLRFAQNDNQTALKAKWVQLAAVQVFSVDRIALYFDNRRPDITVQRNQPVRVFADITYAGSGLLQGYWEVNGRILSYVNQHVVPGNTLTIQTPPIPPIPTFDPGTHVVKFVITNPAKTVPLPSIAYFVAPSDYAGRSIVIKIVSPKDKALIEYAPITFTWEGFKTDASYSIQFYDNPKAEKTVFSMCVLGSSYVISGDTVKMIFVPDKKYYWKIKGCSAENDYGESQLGEFTFKK